MIRRWTVALVVLLAGCSDATGIDLLEQVRIRAEVDRHEAKWSAADVTSYRYSFRRVCDCSAESAGPVEIEVRDGSVHRVRLMATGAEVSPDVAFWPTVDELFDEILLALTGGPTGVEVRFDPVYGYPLEIATEWDGGRISGITLFASGLAPID